MSRLPIWGSLSQFKFRSANGQLKHFFGEFVKERHQLWINFEFMISSFTVLKHNVFIYFSSFLKRVLNHPRYLVLLMITFPRSERPSRPMPDTDHRFLRAVASRILKDPNYSMNACWIWHDITDERVARVSCNNLISSIKLEWNNGIS